MAYCLAQAAPAAGASGSSNSLLIWGVLLIAIGFAIVVLEFFVPSAGVLAVVASACMVVGIVCLFLRDTTAGLIATVLVLIAMPVVIGWGVRLLPETPIFRWLTLDAPASKSEETEHASLVGQEGVAVKDLHPIGPCTINGKRMECLAQGGMIQAGSRVRVTSESAFEVKVRAIEEG
ncbi:NfeD family protein [Mucisphaera calidilacus]|uniref:NfeD integral membrane domain-containing protein n=1 Tax=Mucisphaera calidilacus TaxID=2527982 RepID=A0A518BXL8_9BACT|nr:NfeD family protein [Mucisphaera calidilacus]QDU71727.1 hypothetical protein Pan265_15800 [Mucisphaera calidilacus]